MSLKIRLLQSSYCRCIVERFRIILEPPKGYWNQARWASRYPPEVVAAIIRDNKINKALFGPKIKTKKGTKATATNKTENTEAKKLKSNSKTNLNASTEKTLCKNSAKATVAAKQRLEVIEALGSVIGNSTTALAADPGRMQEPVKDSKSSVKVSSKEDNEIHLNSEQIMKRSANKSAMKEQEIKEPNGKKVQTELRKGIVDANNQEKKKQDMLKSLGTFTDNQSNALVLLANYGLYGRTDRSLSELELKYLEYIDSLYLKHLPSVTKIINDTMPVKNRFFLERWKAQMIEEHGLEGFQKIQEETLSNGRNLHLCIERFLEGESIEDIVPWDKNQGHWNSLKEVLPSFSNVYAKEEMVEHGILQYRGKFDCVAQYKDLICVIDWKTSKKPKPRLSDTFDHPLQLAAYTGALNQSQHLMDRGVDMIRNAVLVICYENGDPAHALLMDEVKLNKYWKLWLKRLQQYWVQLSIKDIRL